MERRADSVDTVLVLGAGGAAGHAYHAGVLRALYDVHGWDARQADLIVGTSAGAQVAALLRAGMSAPAIFAQIVSEPLAFAGSTTARKPRAFLHNAVRRWPASAAYLRSVLRRPWRVRPGPLAAALMWESGRGNDPFWLAYARLCGDRWPARPLWITALDLDTGARVVFGRDAHPQVDVSTAVACSSAVPGLAQPQHVAGARYVDGAMYSTQHLDLLETLPARRVIVSSPLSRYMPLRFLLNNAVIRLARYGHAVELFEPEGEVASAIGWNPLDVRMAPRVADAAYREAVRRLAVPPEMRVTSATTPAASR